ncbi:MAG: glutamate racemase [Clostridiales bacterium]|nr:glutamate racemase [Clostridiales bacterium]
MTLKKGKTEYDNRPIGVFDSGFGGASFLRNALRLLPNERFIYYGDNANAPYGDRTEEEILRLAENAADYLVHKGVKALVVACNTATSAAINALREKLEVPVVSVEPAIKPACEREGDGRVLMLATAATTKLSRYRALKMRMPDPERVIDVGCSGIVERVEKGVIEKDAFDDILWAKLGPYEGMRIDGIVLGCTHFPFIAPAIRRYALNHFTGECRLYDGNEGTAKQLRRVIKARGLEAEPGSAEGGRVTFFTSGDEASCEPIFRMLLSIPIYRPRARKEKE